MTAAGFDIALDNARERRSDRFDQEAFDPSAEGVPHALAVCVNLQVNAGYARTDLPSVQENFP